MPKIKLLKLDCIVNDEIDEDEVYLKHNGKKIWPESGIYKGIDTSESFDINVEVSSENPMEPIVIELWDFDFVSANDHLGNFQMTLGNDTHGKFSTSMTIIEKNSSASYILHWEIIS